jgi:asparagine synthase (glutamine-hydrolysing)
MSMAHSLEVRVPFVDHVFVEHAFPIRAWDKLGFGRTKRILRRSLRSRLPDAHFHAPKRGFIGPTALWLRHELRDMLFDELAGDRLQRLGYFNPRTVRGLLDDHMSRRHNREGLLWALLVFSTWHRLYAETPAVADAGAS